MGQQQLLLLVLATVIVGLATVAGIQAFDENQKQAQQAAMRQRAAAVLTDVRAEFNKPSELGGVDWEEGEEESASERWSTENEVKFLKRMGYEEAYNDGWARLPAGKDGSCSFTVRPGHPTMNINNVYCSCTVPGYEPRLKVFGKYDGDTGEITINE